MIGDLAVACIAILSAVFGACVAFIWVDVRARKTALPELPKDIGTPELPPPLWRTTQSPFAPRKYRTGRPLPFAPGMVEPRPLPPAQTGTVEAGGDTDDGRRLVLPPPACPACGRPALDGHVTCGAVFCNEPAQRRKRADEFEARARRRLATARDLLPPVQFNQQRQRKRG